MDFRTVLGCFATGVAIATTMSQEKEPIGIAVNSFTSVSLDPPLVLFCVAKSARSYTAFAAADYFNIHVMHADQLELVKQFASRDANKFRDVGFTLGPNGVPVIDDAFAHLECKHQALHEGGDHIILVGHVIGLAADDRRLPLVFSQGRFGSFRPHAN